jgi:hypothetical protein
LLLFDVEALTVLLAGFAANSIGSLLKGLMLLRASVAGIDHRYFDESRNFNLNGFISFSEDDFGAVLF